MNHASSELRGPAGLGHLHFFDESPLFFFIFVSVFADHPPPPEGALSLSVFSFTCACVCECKKVARQPCGRDNREKTQEQQD